MSYVTLPSSGGGFANPATENLDMAGFDIQNGDTLEANVVNSTDQATGLKILPSAGTHKLGFFGTTPVVQNALIPIFPALPMPPVYDATALDAEFTAIKNELQLINQLLIDFGLEASV